MSAVSGGSKLQGSISRSGKWEYPGDATVPRPIALNSEYTLRLLVRGNLINAYLNDEFLLAWQSPLERKPGFMQLETFDALAAFDSFQVKPLEPTTKLQLPGGKTKDATKELTNAESAFAFAQRDLKIAEQEKELLGLQLAAMRADWQLQDAGEVSEEQKAALTAQSVEAHRQALSFARQLEVTRFQRTLDGLEATIKEQSGAKRVATEKQVKSTREALEKAQKLLPKR